MQVSLSSTYINNKRQYNSRYINIYNNDALPFMRAAGKLAARTLNYIESYVQVGTSTGYLDQLCNKFIVENTGIPAPLQQGFPKASCISVNHVVCHGIPSDNKFLQQGDIVNIDISLELDGFYGDTSRTFVVGKTKVLAQKLVDTTYDCLMKAIDLVKPGIDLGSIGHIIQTHAQAKGFSVVKDFCGHGLGLTLHEAPEVLHFGEANTGFILEEGVFFTIEPMINAGKAAVKILSDGWTAVTRDKSLSAQFEHSIGVTANGYEIFTELN